MMKAIEVVDIIHKNCAIGSDDESQSHYKKFTRNNKSYAVRVSNHHTVLITWVKFGRNIVNSNNISFVFLDDFSRPSIEDCAFHIDAEVDQNFNRAFRPCQDKKKQDKEFYITTYVYDCSKLNKTDVRLIMYAIKNFISGIVSGYSDPLEREKAGKVYELRFDYTGRPRYSAGKVNGINPTVKIIKENEKEWSFKNYIQYIVECASLLDVWSDEDNVKNLVVGPYQTNNLNESYVIKSPNVINIYD